jgi:hypothetical protein
MGKGRNSRHRKVRNLQSRKIKRNNSKKLAEQKIIRKAKQPQISTMQSGVSRKKMKKDKNMSSSYYNRRDVEFVHIGMNGRFLADSNYNIYVSKLKSFLDNGTITNITFMIFGNWNLKTKNRLLEIVKSNGHAWAINHMIFKLPSEYDGSFLIKRISSFEMTHYADMDKNNITQIVSSNLYGKLKVFFWSENPEEGWVSFKEWLSKYNPKHYMLYEKGEQSGFVIQTGVMSKDDLTSKDTPPCDYGHENYEMMLF